MQKSPTLKIADKTHGRHGNFMHRPGVVPLFVIPRLLDKSKHSHEEVCVAEGLMVDFLRTWIPMDLDLNARGFKKFLQSQTGVRKVNKEARIQCSWAGLNRVNPFQQGVRNIKKNALTKLPCINGFKSCGRDKQKFNRDSNVYIIFQMICMILIIPINQSSNGE